MGKVVLLASGSPRRRDFLESAGVDFRVAQLREVEEVFDADIDVRDVPLFLARQKAEAYLDDLDADYILLTADTDVILGEEVLGKPNGREGAIAMLERLSGKTHSVVSGVCLSWRGGRVEFSVETLVTFKKIGREIVERYVDIYKPYDKAGAYGIQEDMVAESFVERVDGDLSNVIGLPIDRVVDELNKIMNR